MSKKTELLKYCFVISLVLMTGFAVGCATHSGESSPPDAHLSETGNASQTAASGEQKAAAEQVPSTEKEKGRIQIQSQGSETLLKLPIGRKVNVDTEYDGSLLILSCSPALRGPISHAHLDGTVLESLEFSTIPDTNRIEEIRINLKQRTPFSLSRADEDTMELSLRTPDKEAQAASEKAPLRQLRDINFYETDEGGLKIVLTGEEQLKYKLRPSENNELNLALPGTRIPTPQTKLYNLDKFRSPVQKALLSNSPTGGQVHLTMTRRIPVKIRQEGNELNLLVAAQQTQARNTSEVEVQESNASTSEEEQPATASSPDNGTITQFQNTLGEGFVIPGMQDEYTGKPISIDVQDAEVSHVLRLLSNVGNFNLVMDEGVGGTITLKLDEVPWDQVMDNVLRQKGLGLKKVGNRILRVASIDKLRQEQQRNIQVRKSAKEAQQSKEDLAPLHREYIQINYGEAQNLQSQVEEFLSDRGSVSHDPRSQQLIVEDTQSNLEKIKKVINKLDQPEPQVLIEARIVYATDSFSENLGIRWGGGYNYESEDGDSTRGVSGTADNSPSESPGYAVNLIPSQGAATLGLGSFISKLSGTDFYALDAQLQIGESEGKSKTVSKPKIVTLNNEEASVTQGTTIYKEVTGAEGEPGVEEIQASLELSVTPKITPDEKVLLEISINDDDPAVGPGGETAKDTREINTKLIVDDGSTIVIGGVQEAEITQNQDSVPGASRLPILGWLFKNKYESQDKRELLVFIRPKIL